MSKGSDAAVLAQCQTTTGNPVNKYGHSSVFVFPVELKYRSATLFTAGSQSFLLSYISGTQLQVFNVCEFVGRRR